ncbi:MAG TPA: thioredoxin-disulfide reductase [Bacillota bacterium]|nr:thioredoxin-disulfide reductase [Bacillota bacterium]HNT02218.1 thioredoxin-disulfide reductase [Bacillota bacterium]HPA54955.1 thioredoxin-disulfide reductase [Bacillota bacterium]HQA64792.1 thioredoxin-disulfide reductase [Bacillota bacterium]HQO43657.1 thioredoxin-disulfide reductase [Bacillota bacterium]
MGKVYDVVIIGGGPAGLSAGLYASRARMSAMIVEKAKWGGQAGTTEELENYPGSIEMPTGPKLMERMKNQAEAFGTELVKDEVLSIDVSDKIKKIKLGSGNEISARTIIIATGAQPMMLGIPGEAELRGKGVSYCATCDADFFAELEVVVVGGGDAAVEEAIYLTKFAEKVTIVHRRDQFRAAKSIAEKAMKNDKIAIMWDTVPEEIYGDGIVEGIKLRNVKTNEVTDFRTDGVFMFVGTKPISDFAKGVVEMDQKGYIMADEEMRTSVEGIFAAGDVRVKSLRQVVTAAADGAIAAVNAEKYIEKNFEN